MEVMGWMIWVLVNRKVTGVMIVGMKNIRGENMEGNQATLKTEERDFYKCVKSHTGKGFVKELNKAQKEGYKPIWDSREIKRDTTTEPAMIIRTVMCYDTEATGIQDDEKSKRLEIIDTVDMAETYLYGKKSLLEDRENYLLLNTNWDELNANRKEEGLAKINNEKQRTAYLNKDEQLKTLKVEVQEAEQYLKLVKKYAELHELPQRESPWDRKAREAEEKARLEDEQASEVYIEKAGSEPMTGDVDG